MNKLNVKPSQNINHRAINQSENNYGVVPKEEGFNQRLDWVGYEAFEKWIAACRRVCVTN